MQFKINIIDDEKNLNDLVRTYLEKEGYIVYSFYTYDEALMHKNDDVHLWLIDIMLDRSSGFELFNEIKSIRPKMPIIFMSARDQEFDRIIGLEKGSDDYITKPFSMPVLLRKIGAVLRRSQRNQKGEANRMLLYQQLRLDLDNYQVFVAGEETSLTKREFEILKMLLENQGKVMTREILLEQLWQYEFYGNDRVVDNHIKNLRRKLGGSYIETVKGVGYRIAKLSEKPFDS